jgi:hypothetical protein
VQGDLVIEIWGRAKLLFSSKGSCAPRQKSDSWWSGLFGDKENSFDSEQGVAPHGHLPRPLTVQEVLRRRAIAKDTELFEMERTEE